MKKSLSVMLCAVMLASLGSCGAGGDTAADTDPQSGSVSGTAQEYSSAEGIVSVSEKCTNRMSEYERAYAKKREFTLLDEKLPEPEVKLGNLTTTKEVQIETYKLHAERGLYSDEELQELIAEAKDTTRETAMINGIEYDFYIPPKDYDGGEFKIDESTFKSPEDFIKMVREDFCKQNGYDEDMTNKLTRQISTVFDSVINHTYTETPDRYEQPRIMFIQPDPFDDFRSSWEFDKSQLEAIKDHIEEYTVYDDELQLEFIVHVTLPPNYDKNNTYPVLFMTDGVWRLNDHAALYKAMENGEAADTILVSLANSYSIDGTRDIFRDQLLIRNRERLLNFITDNLMPYLGENYNINYAESALLGHSMGGVFSHYALFNSDKYENQPFGKYIIGSPALFDLYDAAEDRGAADAEKDYGYFDRHDSLEKKVFLCGGSQEDPDYASAYDGHDSTLTGLKKMNDRIAAHKSDLTYKLYESHHYQYVPEMLLEYLKTEYPAK